jgi:hypothetical protein
MQLLPAQPFSDSSWFSACFPFLWGESACALSTMESTRWLSITPTMSGPETTAYPSQMIRFNQSRNTRWASGSEWAIRLHWQEICRWSQRSHQAWNARCQNSVAFSVQVASRVRILFLQGLWIWDRTHGTFWCFALRLAELIWRFSNFRINSSLESLKMNSSQEMSCPKRPHWRSPNWH